jgi:CBS domain-containing protein
VEKNGEHKNTLDLKEKSMVQFVDFARTMALKAGIQETNTLDRLKLLSQGGHVPEELAAEAAWAYEFLMQLRLVHQLSRINEGKEPNNFIDPASLTDLEKQTLKESFAVIGRMHNFLRDEFRLRQ